MNSNCYIHLYIFSLTAFVLFFHEYKYIIQSSYNFAPSMTKHMIDLQNQLYLYK